MVGVDSSGWDARYAATDLVWSATPNAVVAREAADLTPGRALDLAAGEGRNAIWLASLGWRVTAVDFSAVATRRIRELADDRLGRDADRVTAVTADLMTWTPEPGSADLVVVAYLQLVTEERRHAHRAAATALAPGGTFLLVAHHSDNLRDGVGGPQDPAVLFTRRRRRGRPRRHRPRRGARGTGGPGGRRRGRARRPRPGAPAGLTPRR